MNDPVLLFCAPLRWVHHLVHHQTPSVVSFYLGLNAWSGMHGLGGFVPSSQLSSVARVPRLGEVRRDAIAAGIAEQVDGGLRIPEYAQRTELLLLDVVKRRQRQDAGRKSGQVRRGMPGQLELAATYVTPVPGEQNANTSRTDAAAKEGFPPDPLPQKTRGGSQKKHPSGKKKRASLADYRSQLAAWSPPGQDAA